MPLKVSDDIGEPTLNLTPMIDIVFLLIIFFMVGTQFAERERQLDVQLPTVSDAQPLTSRPDEIVVNVIDAEVVAVRSEKMSLATLEASLREAKKNYPDQTVVVRGSGPDPYQHVMGVLEVCHRANISHIALANRVQEEP
jgi:biopolymer transport protein ExbD